MISRSAACHSLCVTALLLAVSTLSTPASALTVEKVTFAESVTIGGTPIPVRNAALLRYLKFIKAYEAALYLPDGVTAENVLSVVPKRLEINNLVSIKGPDFGKGADPTLRLNQTPAWARNCPRTVRRWPSSKVPISPPPISAPGWGGIRSMIT